MGWKSKLLSGIMAAVFVLGSTGTAVNAMEISVDNQIPASEVDSVYNQTVNSNTLESWPAGPQIYSESGIVMDADSGAILYAKNIDDQHYPASITKIATALVALENYELTDRVKFDWDCIGFLEPGDAHIGMKPDEEISMEDALYGMLLASANEVSYAIANTDKDGYDSFINKMNEKTKELGGKNTHFANANGLHSDDHYTSARDMALIGSAAFQYEIFRTIINTHQHTIPPTAITDESRTFQQNHKMIWSANRNYYECCVGGKTGYTDQSLTTLVTFASKEDTNLVAVVMRTHGGGQNAYKDTRAMMDYAFENFSKVPVTKEMLEDKNIASIDEKAYVMLPTGVGVEKLEKKVTEPKALGDKTGNVQYTYGGLEVGKFDLTITDKYYNKLHNIEEVKKEDKKAEKKQGSLSIQKIIIGVAAAIVVVFVIVLVVCYKIRLEKIRRRRRRRKQQEQRRYYER